MANVVDGEAHLQINAQHPAQKEADLRRTFARVT
jgi:hypothetical protein